VADVEKILRLVADGVLTPEEADEILSATARPGLSDQAAASDPGAPTPGAGNRARHMRIEVREKGRQTVNLRVPMNLAAWANAFLPGLSDDDSERIRGAIASGTRGPILDVGSEDGDRILITSE
jgi:hypothetical protein